MKERLALLMRRKVKCNTITVSGDTVIIVIIIIIIIIIITDHVIQSVIVDGRS